MFIGEYSHNLDDKNRLSIPAKFRAKLASGCVITRGLDRCLWIYPSNIWQTFAEKISRLPITSKDARSFSRLMLAGASEVELDKNGRVVVPKYLLQYAEIGSKVSINGLYDRIEIWPEEAWSKFKKGMEDNSDEIAEQLSDINL